jgi:hypothetical protein
MKTGATVHIKGRQYRQILFCRRLEDGEGEVFRWDPPPAPQKMYSIGVEMKLHLFC